MEASISSKLACKYECERACACVCARTYTASPGGEEEDEAIGVCVVAVDGFLALVTRDAPVQALVWVATEIAELLH